MTTFKTKSGSTYEVNQEAKQIRRVSGTHDPTISQGPDGEWKSFHVITPIILEYPVMVQWEKDVEKYLRTSRVVEII